MITRGFGKTFVAKQFEHLFQVPKIVYMYIREANVDEDRGIVVGLWLT